ncbi:MULTISPECIES: DUF1656 domain-containing protein [Pseudoxanthomonas]|uniref:DUF1656 domain-containing protein n=1 Tax=Pseudoxanthomonas winnipegensis TaxID=2480810 RepID=A0A4Q8LED4_9GAMM|nr:MULTISPECIES: DUF1656 domain-containing protein [Pseudoxanthomonas]PZP62544.1 MAG: DUF1656 domain-containing protein [Pseudoxanthomonas spadix]TAA27046.1 DUF1656 domain-containing protein [Pseudoxanthomonas winnipegensis]TMN17570.1 DUF1656 domain-containing protein [Pseudoxanthomonas sp. X-1]UAY75692.1 DUF1656 domain-containing protein [Pseudoxanthomonas sp. X-1]
MLPPEISIGGVYAPGLLVLAAGLFVVFWLLDGLAARAGLYRYAWHPPLFRLAVYVCVFGLLGLLLLN